MTTYYGRTLKTGLKKTWAHFASFLGGNFVGNFSSDKSSVVGGHYFR